MPIVMWLNNTHLAGRIISPILTNKGHYKCEDENYIYILFSYIQGYTLCDKPMNNIQVCEIVEIIAIIHKNNIGIPADTLVIEGKYQLPFCDDLEKILIDIADSRNNETEIIDICDFAQSLLYEDIDNEEIKLSIYHLKRECKALYS